MPCLVHLPDHTNNYDVSLPGLSFDGVCPALDVQQVVVVDDVVIVIIVVVVIVVVTVVVVVYFFIVVISMVDIIF